MASRSKKFLAFSFAEVLIVCAIVMVLATLVSIVIFNMRRKADVLVCTKRMMNIHRGLMAYMSEYANSPGFVGDVYAMGLPPDWALATPDPMVPSMPSAGTREDWMCPAPRPPNHNWMPHRYWYPPVPSNPEARPYFAAEAIRLRQELPLVVDLNHNDHTRVNVYGPGTKRILYLNLGGTVVNKKVRKPFSWTIDFFELE